MVQYSKQTFKDQVFLFPEKMGNNCYEVHSKHFKGFCLIFQKIKKPDTFCYSDLQPYIKRSRYNWGKGDNTPKVSFIKQLLQVTLVMVTFVQEKIVHVLVEITTP